MSEPLSTGQPTGLAAARSPASSVRAAIAQAAQATGVDFDYLLAQARIESSLDPSARARTSSAAGLYQFTQGAWLQTLERHGAEHGLEWTESAISGGRLRDPAMRGQVMALRHDPRIASLMAAELASDNRAGLSGVLGREPDAAELYLAHFLGLGGATRMLRADPAQSAAALLPDAAGANRTIFFDASGSPRTVGGVMDLLRNKVAAAMDGAGAPPFIPEGGTPFEPGFAWSAPGLSAPIPADPPKVRPSMAETLKATFALGSRDGQAAPAFVHSAYGRLRSMGL